MPRTLQRAIDDSDSRFHAVGFRYVADLKTTWRGVSCQARYYLSADNVTITEIASHKFVVFRMGGIAYALTSLFDDGTILQSIHYQELHRQGTLPEVPTTSG